MKRLNLFILALGIAGAAAQSPAERMAATIMQRWPAAGDPTAIPWTYDENVWKGLEGLWYNTGDARYFNYVQHQVDRLVDKEGNIRTNKLDGRILLMLYNVTGQMQYYKAAATLRDQLKQQPGAIHAQPFFAEYAAQFGEDSVFDSSLSNAANWDGMTLVDVMDHLPANKRLVLEPILIHYAATIKKAKDPACVYTLAKAVRKGYLPASYRSAADKDWENIQNKFFANPDTPGVGAFLLAADEMAMHPATGKTVLLDEYFNNEHHKDPVTGANVRFHYIFDEMDNNGYAIWGHIFNQLGAKTDTLAVAPTASNLAKAAVYIIVDPDNEKESPAPNYPGDADGNAIENWVKAGGVLVLMANDSANCEFTHFNRLAARFGIQFNFDDYHKVTGNQFEMGAFDRVSMTAQDAIFPNTKKIYIKELSTLSLSGPAKAVFTDAGHTIMAVARVGKGSVFAVGDPWFYNEYTDGRKLPADFENYNAARDLAQWLLQQASSK